METDLERRITTWTITPISLRNLSYVRQHTYDVNLRAYNNFREDLSLIAFAATTSADSYQC